MSDASPTGAASPPDDRINIIGPRPGFSPQVGTLVSMLTWMRGPVLSSVKDLTVAQLDYLHDAKANTIGALLLHLAATERLYQLHTFEGRKWGDWDEKTKQEWLVPQNLGQPARETIKGHELPYYMDALRNGRDRTLAEFRKRDDAWLMQVDPDWPWGPTNNYCKWFHVCEHESHHDGQIKWIKGRLPDTAVAADWPLDKCSACSHVPAGRARATRHANQAPFPSSTSTPARPAGTWLQADHNPIALATSSA